MAAFRRRPAAGYATGSGSGARRGCYWKSAASEARVASSHSVRWL